MSALGVDFVNRTLDATFGVAGLDPVDFTEKEAGKNVGEMLVMMAAAAAESRSTPTNANVSGDVSDEGGSQVENVDGDDDVAPVLEDVVDDDVDGDGDATSRVMALVGGFL